MQGLGEWQSEFAAALMNPKLPPPFRLVNPMGESSGTRFAVYRNNVVRGLVEALRDLFPAACRIVGAEFFDAMARIYVFEHSPRSPILLEYGSDFAEFVAGFEPAACLPYLSDVCRIERAWLEAYHAPEAESISPETLDAISLSEVAELRLRLHPSLRLVSSRFPALTIWSTNIEKNDAIPVDLETGGENVLIVRPEADVEVRGLAHEEMKFITVLSEGSTILYATREAHSVNPEFSPEKALQALAALGALTAFQTTSHSWQQFQERRP